MVLGPAVWGTGNLRTMCLGGGGGGGDILSCDHDNGGTYMYVHHVASNHEF